MLPSSSIFSRVDETFNDLLATTGNVAGQPMITRVHPLCRRRVG